MIVELMVGEKEKADNLSQHFAPVVTVKSVVSSPWITDGLVSDKREELVIFPRGHLFQNSIGAKDTSCWNLMVWVQRF